MKLHYLCCVRELLYPSWCRLCLPCAIFKSIFRNCILSFENLNKCIYFPSLQEKEMFTGAFLLIYFNFIAVLKYIKEACDPKPHGMCHFQQGYKNQQVFLKIEITRQVQLILLFSFPTFHLWSSGWKG